MAFYSIAANTQWAFLIAHLKPISPLGEERHCDLEVSVLTILKIDPATFETAHFDLESSKVAIGPQRYFSTYCLFRKNEKQNVI